MIALLREADRLALLRDALYVLDPQHRLAALEPAVVGVGHLGPLTGHVTRQLEQAAER